MKSINILILGIALLGLISCSDDDAVDVSGNINTIKTQLTVLEEQNNSLKDSINTIIEASESDPLKTKQLERGKAIAVLFQSIARRPEAKDELVDVTTKAVGVFDLSQLTGDNAIDGQSRGIALKELFTGIARQPEAFDALTETATLFVGDFDATIFNDELIEIAKIVALTDLLEGLVRQPEAENLLNQAAEQFLNFRFVEEEVIEEAEL